MREGSNSRHLYKWSTNLDLVRLQRQRSPVSTIPIVPKNSSIAGPKRADKRPPCSHSPISGKGTCVLVCTGRALPCPGAQSGARTVTAHTTAQRLSASRHLPDRLTPAQRSVRSGGSLRAQELLPKLPPGRCSRISPVRGLCCLRATWFTPGLVHAALIRDSHRKPGRVRVSPSPLSNPRVEIKVPLRQNLFHGSETPNHQLCDGYRRPTRGKRRTYLELSDEAIAASIAAPSAVDRGPIV